MNSIASAMDVTWRKSTHSGTNGDCVEIGEGPGLVGIVPVRDSKDPHGPALVFGADAWRSFVSGVAAGDFPTV